MSGVSDTVDGIGGVEGLFEFWDGVCGCDFWRLVGFVAEEGGDVEAGEGFDFVAGASSGLEFWGDCLLGVSEGVGEDDRD